MQNSNIHHSRLDDSVILTLLVTGVLAALVSFFKFVSSEPCKDFNIITSSKNYYVGESIKVSSDLAASKTLPVWDFGDNTTFQSDRNVIYHIYNTAGNYVITLKKGNHCIESINVSIAEPIKIKDSTLLPKFLVPASATVGVPVKFSDSTSNATSWEWRFGESTSVDAQDKTPIYVFKSPGLKTVALVINGNKDYIGTAKIYVNPPQLVTSKKNVKGSSLPVIVIQRHPSNMPLDSANRRVAAPPIPVPIQRAPEISAQVFQEALRKAADNITPLQFFSPYCCNLKEVQTTLNEKNISFESMYSSIVSLKKSSKIKSLKVQLIKNKNTNCIVGVNVTLKTKSRFLGVF